MINLVTNMSTFAALVFTPYSIKGCHFILDHNSNVPWWIFTILLLMETGMNAL